MKENDEVDKNIEALTKKQEQLTNSLTDDQGKMDVIEAGTCHRLQPQFIPASLLMVMSEMDNAQAEEDTQKDAELDVPNKPAPKPTEFIIDDGEYDDAPHEQQA